MQLARSTCLCLALCWTSLLYADDNLQEVKLWPAGLPPGAAALSAERIAELEAKTTNERINFVGEPSMTVQRPLGGGNGCAVVIFPGGGYNILAWPKEGLEIADWFNTLGVTAGVVKYRVPRRDPAHPHVEPLQDGQRAIRWMRRHAEELGIDPDRVGVLGFSAGGHLSVMTGTHWDQPSYEPRDEIDRLSCRPDFMCPIYAAYLGDDYKDDAAELGSLVRVTDKTPPTFMSVTADDAMRGAQAALLFVELKKAGVPAELHVFVQGGHGYGLRDDAPASGWNRLLADWLKATGFVE